MSRVYAARELIWKNNGLLVYGKGKPVVSIVQDEKYKNMWRIKHPDGRLSDMVNRTRAKDAAISVALSILNPSRAK